MAGGGRWEPTEANARLLLGWLCLGAGLGRKPKAGPEVTLVHVSPGGAATWGTSVYELGTNFAVAVVVAVLFFKSSVCF